jgi:hypothetical protein
MMLGVLRTSLEVKDHWLGPALGVCAPDCAGDAWLRRRWGLGGDVRVECWGGVGTAGGTASRRRGDRDLESRSGRGFAGRLGG